MKAKKVSRRKRRGRRRVNNKNKINLGEGKWGKNGIKAFHEAGIRGVCIFDMGARGNREAMPPAGPLFMSDESALEFITSAAQLVDDHSVSRFLFDLRNASSIKSVFHDCEIVHHHLHVLSFTGISKVTLLVNPGDLTTDELLRDNGTK